MHLWPRYAEPPFPRLHRLRARLSPSRVIFERFIRVYLVLAALGILKRSLAGRTERVVIAGLKPGQRLTVSTIAVQSAKERKRLLRGQN